MELNIESIRKEIIGSHTFFNTPYGKRLITYADYTASGRTLTFIENYLIKLQEVYANTHTTDSFTGKTMTGILHKAEKNIKKYLGANENNYIIPTGTGATGAIVKLSEILGLYLTPGLKMNIDYMRKRIIHKERYNQEIIKDIFKHMSETKPIIFVSSFEHHSNYLIWKESFAEVIEISLTSSGKFDYLDLENKCDLYKDRIKIGSFSAASNITGMKNDVYLLAKIMHKHHGLAFFDFAASGPYVEINMNKDENCYFDAIFLSPHKFVGGPGSAGILVINKNLYSILYPPTVAGGGTVSFVSPYCYEFTKDVEARENAGTPGILQVIKAALALEFKQKIGIKKIVQIEENMIKKAINELKNEPNIEILGSLDPEKRVSILSFIINQNDKYLHYKLIAKLLNDLFGIQSRAGCACAGPYAHRLLGIDEAESTLIKEIVDEGMESLKPGFVRVNFHYLMSDEEVEFVINAIKFIAHYGYLFLTQYKMEIKSGNWSHNYLNEYNSIVDSFGLYESFNISEPQNILINKKSEFNKYFDEANKTVENLKREFQPNYKQFQNKKYEDFRWFNFIHHIND
ncbi:aminotransferase class V-fold PLP-dependent enzyme [Mycoplasmatota bacterium]|nr:aminotransferase class V-fold PLP-dependent enzyme [Mycoplasmatota bacterium]